MKTLLRIIRIIKHTLKKEEKKLEAQTMYTIYMLEEKKLEAQTMYTIYMPDEKLPYKPETIIDVECEIM